MPSTAAKRTIAPMPGSMGFFEFKMDLTQVSFMPAAGDAWRIEMPLRSRAARMGRRRLLMGSCVGFGERTQDTDHPTHVRARDVPQRIP
jgi:hypothetical protein